VTALAAGRLPAAPVQLEVEGVYQDGMYDAAGLDLLRNVNVGPRLTPGVRVSLSAWSWAQSYSADPTALWTPFDDSGATHNLTQVIRFSATGFDQAVSLWQRIYRVSESMDLATGLSATTYMPNAVNWSATMIVIPDLAGLTGLPGRFAFRGPRDTTLLPSRDYEATFRSFFCDDPPNCKAPAMTAGAELGFYEVSYGNLVATYLPFKAGSYTGTPPGDFYLEGITSPVTLEWQVPYPLPPGDGWEYRFRVTMNGSGSPASPACAPNCSATLWADTVTVMAKGHHIPVKGFIPDGACGVGLKPCGTQCIPDGAPCGWDAATLYVDSGSYVSPVFDSLSSETEWKTIFWNVEQNYTAGGSNGWPRTPVTIKWRVGNSLDPRTWLEKPEWYTWTIPNTVTCSGEEINCASTSCALGPCDCSNGQRPAAFPCLGGEPDPYRVPMPNTGTTSLYSDGTATYAKGRYFQYEVDFTAQTANDPYPPEADPPYLARELHDALRPFLNGIQVTYQPARGQVLSKTVRPSQLRKWKSVSFEADTASGGSVTVDVLDEHGIPLFTNIPSGFSLAGLDSDRYPALKLRATVDNGGLPHQRPSLLSWELRWDTFSEPLLLNRNAINLSQDETCRITIVITAARPGALTIHDSSGQLVKTLFDGVFPAGVQTWTWNGVNLNGQRVATGVYFVSLHAKDVRRVKKLAVSR